MSDLRITILKNDAPWGPFTRQQIEEGLIRGDFTRQDLAHAPGVKEWRPLGEVIDHVEESTVLPPLPKNAEINAAKAPAIPAPPPILPEANKSVAVAPPVEEKPTMLLPASFIPRCIAFLIDCAILFVPLVLLFIVGAILLEVGGAWENIDHESRMQEWALLKRNLTRLFLLVAIGLGWVYAAGLEASPWQATVGKRWMGIRVTDDWGQRVGFLRATGRHWAKYLSAALCFLGFLMALFGSRRLALHDRLAGARVVKKPKE